MPIQVNFDEDFVIGTWYVEAKRNRGNLWVMLYRRPAGNVVVDSRLRVYVDDLVGTASRDKRHFIKRDLGGITDEEAIRLADSLVLNLMPSLDESSVVRKIIKAAGQEALDAITSLPFVHVQTVPLPKPPKEVN